MIAGCGSTGSPRAARHRFREARRFRYRRPKRQRRDHPAGAGQSGGVDAAGAMLPGARATGRGDLGARRRAPAESAEHHRPQSAHRGQQTSRGSHRRGGDAAQARLERRARQLRDCDSTGPARRQGRRRHHCARRHRARGVHGARPSAAAGRCRIAHAPARAAAHGAQRSSLRGARRRGQEPCGAGRRADVPAGQHQPRTAGAHPRVSAGRPLGAAARYRHVRGAAVAARRVVGRDWVQPGAAAGRTRSPTPAASGRSNTSPRFSSCWRRPGAST